MGLSESLEDEYKRKLDSEICPHCTRSKVKGKPFCLRCFRLLPGNLKNKLYRAFSEGFTTTYDDAFDWLRFNDE